MPIQKVYSDFSDEELFAIIHKNKRAESEFYRRYKNRVKWFLRKYKLNSLEREDLIQEGMIGLFNAIESYDRQKGVKFYTYANVCIRNRITNSLQSLWNKKKNLTDEQDVDDVSIEQNPEDNVIIGEISKSIQNAVVNLSDMEKQVLTRYLDKKSYNQISVELNISSKKVDNILMKIKGKLGANMQKSRLNINEVDVGIQLKNSIHRGLDNEVKH